MSKSVVIGSRPDCDLVVHAPSVSGRHCRVSRDGPAYVLEDLNSTNGTYFQGQRVAGSLRVTLADDVSIYLGSYALLASKVLALLGNNEDSPPVVRAKEMIIGRGAGCDHVIDLPMVSSRHARVFRSGGQLWIEDLRSSNGTFVNGKRIEAATPIQPGDSLALGSFSLVLDEESWKTPEVADLSTRPVLSQKSERPVLAHGGSETTLQSVPAEGTEKASDRDALVTWALAAQTVLAALAVAALSRLSWPVVLYGLAVASTWLGLSTGLASQNMITVLKRYAWKGTTGRLAHHLALVMLCLAQCLIVWIVARCVAPGGNVSLLALGVIGLTSLVGLALGLAILWLSPHPSIAWSSGGVILVLLCLFSGLQPKLEHQPAAIRPISGLLPSRWAFEGLLLLQSQRSPAPTSAVSDGSVQPDPAEIYFPVATQRMGLTADVLALLLMLIGLSALAAWRSTSPLGAACEEAGHSLQWGG